jgi:hypothetical protein
VRRLAALRVTPPSFFWCAESGLADRNRRGPTGVTREAPYPTSSVSTGLWISWRHPGQAGLTCAYYKLYVPAAFRSRKRRKVGIVCGELKESRARGDALALLESDRFPRPQPRSNPISQSFGRVLSTALPLKFLLPGSPCSGSKTTVVQR